MVTQRHTPSPTEAAATAGRLSAASVLAGWLILFATPSLPAATITVTGGSLFIRAFDGVSVASENTITATTGLNTTDSETDSSVSGGTATNSTSYAFSDAGFLITVDHTRGKAGNAHTQSRDGGVNGITFTLDQDEPYTLSGTYTLSGSNRLVLFAELKNLTTNQTLFSNTQESFNTPNESFTLGELGGDSGFGLNNSLSGSLTGTLTAGQTYGLRYNFLVQHSGSNTTADADGQVLLQIGTTATAVPEPSSLLLAGFAALGLYGSWRRRRHRASQPPSIATTLPCM